MTRVTAMILFDWFRSKCTTLAPSRRCKIQWMIFVKSHAQETKPFTVQSVTCTEGSNSQYPKIIVPRACHIQKCLFDYVLLILEPFQPLTFSHVPLLYRSIVYLYCVLHCSFGAANCTKYVSVWILTQTGVLLVGCCASVFPSCCDNLELCLT